MSLKAEILVNAKADSRRFAKGTLCSIIHDDDILNFMIKKGIIPRGLKLISGFDARVGRLFAIPTSLEKDLKYYTQRFLYQAEENIMDNLESEETLKRQELQDSRRLEEPLEDFLRQSVFMVTVPALMLPNGSLPDPQKYQVKIETTDIGQTLSCSFVTPAGRFTTGEGKNI